RPSVRRYSPFCARSDLSLLGDRRPRREAMNLRRKLMVAAMAALASGAATAPARAAQPDHHALNATLVEDYVMPRYRAFAEATASLDAALAEACPDGQPTVEEAGP